LFSLLDHFGRSGTETLQIGCMPAHRVPGFCSWFPFLVVLSVFRSVLLFTCR
jgi:hypothetical protein